MDEKLVRETIETYERVEDRAREIAKLTKIVNRDEWIDAVAFNADTIEYTIGFSHCGYCEYERHTLPLEYLWMEDQDVLAGHEEAMRKESEEKRKEEEARETEEREKLEKEERRMYEKLKAKYE